MVRSYEVDVFLDDSWCGFVLTCYEDDDCIWEQFFTDSVDAHAQGSRFLDGCYIRGFDLQVA